MAARRRSNQSIELSATAAAEIRAAHRHAFSVVSIREPAMCAALRNVHQRRRA